MMSSRLECHTCSGPGRCDFGPSVAKCQASTSNASMTSGGPRRVAAARANLPSAGSNTAGAMGFATKLLVAISLAVMGLAILLLERWHSGDALDLKRLEIGLGRIGIEDLTVEE